MKDWRIKKISIKRNKKREEKRKMSFPSLPPPRMLVPVTDTARRVKFEFEIKYDECDLADEILECKPVLLLYLSNQFERRHESGGIINIHLDEHDLSKTYAGSLIGTLRRQFASQLPLMAACCFYSFALQRNDQGETCWVIAGTAKVPLRDIIPAVKNKGSFTVKLPLEMETVCMGGKGPLTKGSIVFRINNMELGKDVQYFPGLHSALTAPADHIASTIGDFVQQCVTMEMQLADLFPNTERVRAPMDISPAGRVANFELFIPVAALCIQEVPKANADFFRNALAVTLKRMNVTLSDYYAHFDAKERARVMGNMVSIAVQSFIYIGDGAYYASRRQKLDDAIDRSRTPLEIMLNIWTTTYDDCESSALGILVVLEAFVAITTFDTNANPHDRALIELQSYTKQYMPALMLAIVHGAKIGDEEGFGAHMYLHLYHESYWKACYGRTDEGKKLLQRLTPATDPLIRAGVQEKSQQQQQSLPASLVLEGTGILDCIGYSSEPSLESMRYIASNIQDIGWKMRIPRLEGKESPFYAGNVLGVTNAHIKQGVNIGAFVVCSKKEGEADMKRGATFVDQINGSSNVAFLPQPIVPAPVMEIVREAIATRPPPRDLVLDYTKPLMGEEKQPDLERLKTSIAKQGRVAKKGQATSVDLIARSQQVTPERIAALEKKLLQMDRVYAVDYNIERITNQLYNYRVSIFVNPAPAAPAAVVPAVAAMIGEVAGMIPWKGGRKI
jgi:hypothetical protein